MAIQSKLISDKNVLSYFDSVPFTCYEIGHTWEPRCYVTWLQTLQDSLKFSVKVYVPFYLASLAFKMRKKERRNIREVGKVMRNAAQSIVFLSSAGTLSMGVFCSLRAIMRKFYGWHGMAVGFIVGYLTIAMERKSRRSMLALYLGILATETMFRMAVARNMLTPIQNGEVLISCIASAGLMALYRTPSGLKESLQKPLSYFVGKCEGGDDLGVVPLHQSSSLFYQNSFTQAVHAALQRLKDFHPRHHSCPHYGCCLYYMLKGSFKQFLLGYAVELGFNSLQLLRRRRKFSSVFTTFSLASFLGGYTMLFRAVNCILRWLRNKDSPTIHGATAGAIAGISSWFYKSSTISLYFLFKLFEVLLLKTTELRNLPYLENADQIIYALSLSILLHAASLEPHNIRPSYWKFLQKVSGGRFHLMFRTAFDVFGTNASALYPNFIPDLDPNFVTTPEIRDFFRSHGKWN